MILNMYMSNEFYHEITQLYIKFIMFDILKNVFIYFVVKFYITKSSGCQMVIALVVTKEMKMQTPF